MESITQLSRQIHRKGTRIWHLKKAVEGVPKYAFEMKNLDVPYELAKEKMAIKELIAQREQLKTKTPKNLWYPKKKYCGRYKNDSSKAITRVMQDAFNEGFNVKTIAGYFNYTLACVYRRIQIKNL